MAVNLLNLENVTVAHGTRLLMDSVSLGVSEGDRIGVVGRNGGGKTTLLKTLIKTEEPHSGRVTHSSGLRIGVLTQDVRVDVRLSAHQAIIAAKLGLACWLFSPITTRCITHRALQINILANNHVLMVHRCRAQRGHTPRIRVAGDDLGVRQQHAQLTGLGALPRAQVNHNPNLCLLTHLQHAGHRAIHRMLTGRILHPNIVPPQQKITQFLTRSQEEQRARHLAAFMQRVHGKLWSIHRL